MAKEREGSKGTFFQFEWNFPPRSLLSANTHWRPIYRRRLTAENAREGKERKEVQLNVAIYNLSREKERGLYTV